MLIRALLIYAVLANADSLDFFFSANGSCPQIPWTCVQDDVLAACGYDTIVDRYYCCGAAAQASCRTTSVDCVGNNGGPSSIQQLCTAGQSSWCCLRDTEMCTPRPGQIDVCYALAPDTIGNVSQEFLDDAFSSLSSAHPEATTFSFDAASLSAQAALPSTSSAPTASSDLPSSTLPADKSTTTGTSGSLTTTSSLDTKTSPSSTLLADKHSTAGSSKPLTDGAIAGIAIGSAGVIAIFVAAYVVFRRQSYQKFGSSKDISASHEHSPAAHAYYGRGHDPAKVMHSNGPIELVGSREAQELDAERAYELRG